MRVCGIIGGVKTYQTLLFAFAIFAAFAEGQPFSRYQTIIDRKPFGPEPANFDPEAAPGTASAAGAAGAVLPTILSRFLVTGVIPVNLKQRPLSKKKKEKEKKLNLFIEIPKATFYLFYIFIYYIEFIFNEICTGQIGIWKL